MIRIDLMRLRLPAGYEHRADRIARAVADELGREPVPASAEIASLEAAPVTVPGAASDGDVAREIAGSIRAAMARRMRGGVS